MKIPAEISYVHLQYSHTVGRHEEAGPGFSRPVFVARGEGELLYVISRSSEHRPDGIRICVCTVGEDYVTEFARGVAQPGPHEYSFADGSLVWPTSLAFDKEWNVYVADEWLNRISIFSRDGEYLGKWGMPGDGDGELHGPSGLAFDQDDNLYLVDSLNNRIQKFTRNGQFLGQVGYCRR